MNKLIRFGIAAAFIGMGASGAALADTASTTGGLKIKSDDGNFEASFGGRIHLDAIYIDPDNASSTGFGSSVNNYDNASGFRFRRVWFSTAGKLYGWQYHIDDDFSGSNSASGLQDVWAAHNLGPGTIYIGQHKVWRSMEEIGSSNNTLFLERPITSASGIMNADFRDGLFYGLSKSNVFVGLSAYSETKAGSNSSNGSSGSTQGFGGNVRLAWAPINEPGKLLHIGGSYSSDNYDNGNTSGEGFTYGGYKLNNAVKLTFASGAKSVDTYTVEFAGILGPAFLNAEYASAKNKYSSGSPDATVDGYYIQASYFLTGESKKYSTGDATIGNPKPKNSYGAFELKVRYEYGENGDVDSTTNPGGCTASGLAKGTTIDKCEVSAVSAGVNWYVNPAVRFMLDYVAGSADLGSAGKDEPNTIAARMQISF